MADAETPGIRDEHGRIAEPVPRPGSDGEHYLQGRLRTTERADRFYDEQVLDHLNERMRDFVGRQEMFFLATADRHGECDNSFRAGPPGFLRVLDDGSLLYPEYRGNGVHASLGNLQENPHVGLLLMDFTRARIGLHVNGRAEIWEDPQIRTLHPDLPVDPVPGRRAQLWVRVRVEEAYIHCAKHIPHLQPVPKGGGREWGTDDYKRKGGDFFGTARDARERGAVERSPREHTPPPLTPPAAPPPPTVPAVSPAQAAQAPAGALPHTAAPPAPPSEPPRAHPAPTTQPTPAIPRQHRHQEPQHGEPQHGPVHTVGTSAAAGASAVIAARATVPDGEDTHDWRREAERALDQARQRVGGSEQHSFQGWFS